MIVYTGIQNGTPMVVHSGTNIVIYTGIQRGIHMIVYTVVYKSVHPW